MSPHHEPFSFHVDLFSTYIPIALLILPWLFIRFLNRVTGRVRQVGKFPYLPHAWLLGAAGAAWFWSIQLWNLPVTPDSQSTTIHLMGGAIVAPALLAYLIRGFGWSWPKRAGDRFLLLFAFVNAFGILNEIAELVLNSVGSPTIYTRDTWWDLGTGAAGAVIAFAVMELFRLRRR